MTDYQSQQNLQRNKMFAQTAESVLTHATKIGVDIFKALIKFIQEMIAQAFGK